MWGEVNERGNVIPAPREKQVKGLGEKPFLHWENLWKHASVCSDALVLDSVAARVSRLLVITGGHDWEFLYDGRHICIALVTVELEKKDRESSFPQAYTSQTLISHVGRKVSTETGSLTKPSLAALFPLQLSSTHVLTSLRTAHCTHIRPGSLHFTTWDYSGNVKTLPPLFSGPVMNHKAERA